jgi:hypothetical protein
MKDIQVGDGVVVRAEAKVNRLFPRPGIVLMDRVQDTVIVFFAAEEGEYEGGFSFPVTDLEREVITRDEVEAIHRQLQRGQRTMQWVTEKILEQLPHQPTAQWSGIPRSS